MKAGTRLEAQFQSNKSLNNDGGTREATANAIDLRYQDLYLSGAFGKVSLGKGDGAGNGTTEVDLSGTYIIAAANATDLYGGFLLDSTTKVSGVYDIVDAYSRNNRLRYDSNNFNGFSFAVSYGQQEVTELALRYAGGTDIKYQVEGFVGSIGETTEGYDDGNESAGISGSVLLANGLNLTVSYSMSEPDDVSAAALAADGQEQERENMWVKLGYKTGKHAFSIDYGETEDTDGLTTTGAATTDTEAETMGVSYVFSPAKGVELFAGYREYSSDDVVGTDNTDVELVTVGSLVKF